jgi:nucleotide-binding universal stress UspA family protein
VADRLTAGDQLVIVETIVVGTDGSENAALALRWAAAEAEVHGCELAAVLAWSFLDQYHADRSDTFAADYTEDTAKAALASWVADELGPGASVEQRVVCDVPVRALLEASDAADLLVLGARGRGGFEGLLLGSVSERVAQLATRPVAVVRASAPVRGGRVVVGVDGSARSRNALRWAAAEARARDSDLDVVHAWRLPMLNAPPVVSVFPDLSAMEDAGRAVLDSALADPSLAGIRVHRHLTPGGAARVMTEQAAGAGLVVVGTRGLGRVTGTLLGSVSRQLLQHAPCPVVVI